MARIPEAEIERLKEAVPVARLVEASGIELKKGGKDMLGRCPFRIFLNASLLGRLQLLKSTSQRFQFVG